MSHIELPQVSQSAIVAGLSKADVTLMGAAMQASNTSTAIYNASAKFSGEIGAEEHKVKTGKDAALAWQTALSIVMPMTVTLGQAGLALQGAEPGAKGTLKALGNSMTYASAGTSLASAGLGMTSAALNGKAGEAQGKVKGLEATQNALDNTATTSSDSSKTLIKTSGENYTIEADIIDKNGQASKTALSGNS